MRKVLKNIIQSILAGFAKTWLKRKKPKIVGITGSCGKTSIKEAVYSVLSCKYQVKRSEGNYNTEFGVPLSILGLKSGYSSPLAWIKILFQAFFKAFFDLEHVDILVLEMGVDKPGDMDMLLSFANIDVAIFSNVKPAHLAEDQFKDLDAIFEEKGKLVKSLQQFATAILNIDDVRVKRLANDPKCKVFTYSTVDNESDFFAEDLEMTENGLQFFVRHGNERAFVSLPILGEYQAYVLLPALACGAVFDINLKDAASALSEFDLPPGRMNILAGKNESILIDSSYNASPDAVFEALKILKKVGDKMIRKIAVLGNMNELGEFTDREHRRIGRKASECCDLLIAVGDYTKSLCEEARRNGLSDDKVFWFKDVFEAIEFLKSKVERGDIILLKGSQNKVRLEILVKELLRDSSKASELLVRQGKEWNNLW